MANIGKTPGSTVTEQLGENGPLVMYRREKDGTISQTLLAPPVDMTLSVAAMILSQNKEKTQEE